MNKLKIALFVKPSPSTRERDKRNMGYWSYPVMQFEWVHFCPHGSVVDTRRFREFDLIFWEDGGDFRFDKHAGDPPVVYMSIDGTLSSEHLTTRLRRSSQADLILVDHQSLTPYKKIAPTRRLNYCVNDLVFKPVETKTIDVTFHCGTGARKGMPGGAERVNMRQKLHDICKRHDWSYRSGTLGLFDYAKAMASSRVVVNVPRTPTNRPHRIFDTLACRTALLSTPFPTVAGDNVVDGNHYLSFANDDELEEHLVELIDDKKYEQYARRGHVQVTENHTWSVRAVQLRAILKKELGL